MNSELFKAVKGDILTGQSLTNPLHVEYPEINRREVKDVRSTTNQGYVSDRSNIHEGVNCVTHCGVLQVDKDQTGKNLIRILVSIKEAF